MALLNISKLTFVVDFGFLLTGFLLLLPIGRKLNDQENSVFLRSENIWKTMQKSVDLSIWLKKGQNLRILECSLDPFFIVYLFLDWFGVIVSSLFAKNVNFILLKIGKLFFQLESHLIFRLPDKETNLLD